MPVARPAAKRLFRHWFSRRSIACPCAVSFNPLTHALLAVRSRTNGNFLKSPFAEEKTGSPFLGLAPPRKHYFFCLLTCKYTLEPDPMPSSRWDGYFGKRVLNYCCMGFMVTFVGVIAYDPVVLQKSIVVLVGLISWYFGVRNSGNNFQ